MTKQEKNEVIELLKGKFSQYNNFYITDTESLTVAQIGKLRNVCFDKQVEMKVAKNTLIRKALESIDAEKYAGVYDSLHKVTALLFSENPKDPAVIISGFRKANNNERPVLKAAFINGDVFVGDNQLKALTQIKTKNELIGEVIGLLQAPIQRVLGALQNKDAAAKAPASEETAAAKAPASEETAAAKAPASEETAAAKAPASEEVAPTPVAEEASPVPETAVAETPATETPVASAPEATPETPAADAEATKTDLSAEA
jgi:large subunit ribosomal protein L10